MKYMDKSFSVSMFHQKEPQCAVKGCLEKVFYQKGNVYFCKKHFNSQPIEGTPEQEMRSLGDLGKL